MAGETSQAVEVSLYPVRFGSLAISCPLCECESTGVFVGLTTVEDTENPVTEDGLANMVQIGVVVYPCDDVFASACLTERVATILNARETDSLRLGMFYNLISCDEHGVEYPGQS